MMRKSAKKKLEFEEQVEEGGQIIFNRSLDDREIEESEQLRPGNIKDKTVAKFVEDGVEVIFEVEGQGTEFSTDNEENEENNESSEDEDMEEGEISRQISRNNNATLFVDRSEPRATMSSVSGGDKCCQGNEGQQSRSNKGAKNKRIDDGNEGKLGKGNEEEEGMQCFVDYINKKGLVIVNAEAIRSLGKNEQDCGGNLKSSSAKQSNITRNKEKTNISQHKETGESEKDSIITVYKNAVNRMGEDVDNNLVVRIWESDEIDQDKRYSSSSDDIPLDSSGDIDTTNGQMDNLDLQTNQLSVNDQIGNFVTDLRQQSVVNRRYYNGPKQDKFNRTDMRQHVNEQQPELGTSKTQQLIRNAELSKTRIYDVKGNVIDENGKELNVVVHSALLDKDYLLVGSYVDEITRQKIGNGEYVDFSKLMPKDKIAGEEDHQMEMVNKGRMSYWLPVADREATTVSSYMKWEQAFRVFSNIYNDFHPHRASELIQYNHIIYTASQSFVWENVYKYDREFRLHIAKHHIHRSWGIILQQAWSMFLKDRVNHYHNKEASRLYAELLLCV